MPNHFHQSSGKVALSLKYIRINLSCPSILSLHNLCLPKTEPPRVGSFVARQAKSIDMFSSSPSSSSSSDESFEILYKHKNTLTSSIETKIKSKNGAGGGETYLAAILPST